MKKLTLLLCASTMIFLLAGCDQDIPPDSKVSEKSLPASTPREPIDDELAVKEIWKHINNTFVKKGDSYYVLGVGKEFVEAKEVAVTMVSSEPASAADKLNGVEWLGRFALTASASRTRYNGPWKPWSNGLPKQDWGSFYNYEVIKSNGRFLVKGSATEVLKRPPADMIPQN